MTLLSRTKEIAKKRGMSMESLANKVGISKSGIYQWDKHEPKPSTIQKVADVLHVSTDYLLGRTNEMNATSCDKKVADILDDETILAFDGMEIEESEKEKLRDYARYIISLREKENK